MPTGSKTQQQQPAQAMELEAKGVDRAAGQHLRAMRRTSQPTTSPKEPTA